MRRPGPNGAGALLPLLESDPPRTLLSTWRDDGTPSPGELVRLWRTLDGPVALHRPGWRRPSRVDPALVVGAAIDLCDGDALLGPAADVVMSTLLVHAARGNPAADLVLRHARTKAARRHRTEANRRTRVPGGRHEGRHR